MSLLVTLLFVSLYLEYYEDQLVLYGDRDGMHRNDIAGHNFNIRQTTRLISNGGVAGYVAWSLMEMIWYG